MNTPASGSARQGQSSQHSAPTRSLRSYPDLKQLKRQAKDLLKRYLASDASAVEEVKIHFHSADPASFALHDAQTVIARAYGASSWPKLIEQIRSRTGSDTPGRVSERLKQPFNMSGRQWRRESVIVDGDQAWALFRACADGDEPQVHSLISRTPDLYHAQLWYNKPIEFAVREGHCDIVHSLLESDHRRWLGSVVYADGHTIGRRDVRHRGYEEMDRLLMAYKMAQAPRYTQQFELLGHQIQVRDLNLVKDVLRDEDLLHASDFEGNSALHIAIICNAFDIAEYLVRSGADVNAVNSRHATSLDLSLDEASLTAYLLTYGAEWTLAAAVRTGHLEQARSLLEGDPTTAQQLDAEEHSLLWHAVCGGHTLMVKLLLDHGADPNAPERGAHHGAALHKAANLDRREIVDLLLVNGADPNGGVDSSSPPIEYAKENVRRSLLKAGA